MCRNNSNILDESTWAHCWYNMKPVSPTAPSDTRNSWLQQAAGSQSTIDENIFPLTTAKWSPRKRWAATSHTCCLKEKYACPYLNIFYRQPGGVLFGQLYCNIDRPTQRSDSILCESTIVSISLKNFSGKFHLLGNVTDLWTAIHGRGTVSR